MKKTALSMGLMAAVCMTGAAQAEEPRWPNWYVGLHGGVNIMADSEISTSAGSSDLDSDEGFLGGASFGYVPPTQVPFFNMTRWEMEYTYRSNNNDSVDDVEINGKAKAHSFMGNMFVDFENDTSWTPYVGAGLGMANIEYDLGNEKDDDNVFAWQLMAGLSFEPKSIPMTVWGIGYRYFDTQDGKYTYAGEPTKIEYVSHGIEGKVRFRF